MPEQKLTLVEHLAELRSRAIKSVVFIILTSGLIYNLSDKVLACLVKPVGRLVFIAPQEAFVTNIKIAFFGGVLLSSPFLIYQIWRFVSAGLNSNEKRYTLIFGPLSFLLFLTGISFGYFIIVPIGVKFLLGFATDFLIPMISIGRYVSFVGTMSFAFGAIFEVPLLLLFLTKIGIVTPGFLSQKRKHAIVIIFILAAFLTPPDIITQCLMAGPLIILYEAGIIFSRLGSKR